MDEIELVEGDTFPLLTGVVDGDDGAPVDITGWGISLHIDYEVPLVKAADVPVGTDGFFSFAFEPDDLVPGRWPAEIQVTSAVGTQTFRQTTPGEKIMLRIHRQIA